MMKHDCKLYLILFIGYFFYQCQVTSHQFNTLPVESSSVQIPQPSKQQPMVDFQVIKAADWEVPLAGLLDLEHPQSKLANLKDKPEPISIYFYLIKHPKLGSYLIDSGIGESFTKGKEELLVSSIVASQMNFDKLKIFETTKNFLEKNKIDLKGIFFTHLHLDHVMGAYEVNRNVPFYVGQNEVSDKQFINLFVQSSTNRLLGENANLIELNFGNKGQGLSIIDFFGDQSLFIISVPGHTAGSLAFLIPSKDGGHLILGDTCHTRFGWLQNVIPGSFTSNPNLNRKSLDGLKSLVSSYKPKYIYPGHQERIVSDIK